jgi:hypothetical protein
VNSKNLTASEREHMGRVKALPCAVCESTAGSDAHHIEQGMHYAVIPLCKDCHQGSFNGIHGQRRIWQVLKKTELSCLNWTIQQLTKDR